MKIFKFGKHSKNWVPFMQCPSYWHLVPIEALDGRRAHGPKQRFEKIKKNSTTLLQIDFNKLRRAGLLMFVTHVNMLILQELFNKSLENPRNGARSIANGLISLSTSAPVFATVYNWENEFKRGHTYTKEKNHKRSSCRVCFQRRINAVVWSALKLFFWRFSIAILTSFCDDA